MVETGMRVPPSAAGRTGASGCWPGGRRRSARRDAGFGQLRRVEGDDQLLSVPPVRSALATPSSAWISGTISVRAISATPLEAVLGRGRDRGDDDRRRVDVQGLDGGLDRGRQPGARDFVLDGRDRLLDVAAELELGHDKRDRVRRGRLERLQPRHARDRALDRLGDLLGDVARAGARVRRDDGDDREVDVRQELLLESPQAEIPKMNTAAASSSVTLRWLRRAR